jgi:hypothetical protein
MPLVTLTLRPGKPKDFKLAILGAVHGALVASGVPEKDRFQRVLELGPDDFRFDGEYPDLPASRTDDFVLIEILWSVGGGQVNGFSPTLWRHRQIAGLAARRHHGGVQRKPPGKTGRSPADASFTHEALSSLLQTRNP